MVNVMVEVWRDEWYRYGGMNGTVQERRAEWNGAGIWKDEWNGAGVQG